MAERDRQRGGGGDKMIRLAQSPARKRKVKIESDVKEMSERSIVAKLRRTNGELLDEIIV